MGESSEKGTATPVVAVIGMDDLADAVEATSAPSAFPVGSEVHAVDDMLAAYLQDVELAAPRPNQASWRVLLIESDSRLRVSLWEMLEAAGHTVITSPSSAGALEMLGRHPVDVVLADVESVSAGLELRYAVHGKRPALPVLLLSDDPMLAETWSVTDLCSAGFVEKPVHGLLLLAALREAMKPLG